MNLFSKTLFISITLITSTLAHATSPITLINNTNYQLSLTYTHCNSQNFCTMNKNLQLEGNNQANNLIKIMAPVGMDNFSITTGRMVDNNQNKIAGLERSCNPPSEVSVVILDNYGSNEIICTYGYGS